MRTIDYFQLTLIAFTIILVLYKLYMLFRFKTSGKFIVKIHSKRNNFLLVTYCLSTVCIIFFIGEAYVTSNYTLPSYTYPLLNMLLITIISIYCEGQKSKISEGGFTYRGNFIKWDNVTSWQWWLTKDSSFIFVVSVAHRRFIFRKISAIKLDVPPTSRGEIDNLFKKHKNIRTSIEA